MSKISRIISNGIGLWALVGLLATSLPAQGAVVYLVDPNSGADSGWVASYSDLQDVSITVNEVDLVDGFVRLEIDKPFTDPPGPGDVFPPIIIDFTQVKPDPNTVPEIRIAEESVTNHTDVDWYDYHWILTDSRSWFDVSASVFSTAPFTEQSFSNFQDVGQTMAMELNADGGVVADGATFYPGSDEGDLVIGVDLSGVFPVSAEFKQLPTIPEPSVLALLAVSVPMVFAPRRASRARRRR